MAPIIIEKRENPQFETLNSTQIDEDLERLLSESVKIRKCAYVPYSKFQVGAALLCSDGTIFNGCNVENASFGLTICAERTAIVKAVSEGKREFVSIAISAVMGDEYVTPCGACRQFLCEFNPDIKIYLHNPGSEKTASTSLSYLLPRSFNPQNVHFS